MVQNHTGIMLTDSLARVSRKQGTTRAARWAVGTWLFALISISGCSCSGCGGSGNDAPNLASDTGGAESGENVRGDEQMQPGLGTGGVDGSDGGVLDSSSAWEMDADRPSPADAGESSDSALPEDAAIPPAPRIVISEVVVSPRQDWSNSDDTGIPYDYPGSGKVSGQDQYVELQNLSGETVDLTGWRLSARDGSPATTVLGTGDATLVFSDGSSLDAVAPNAFIVIGGPDGYISTDAFIELFDAGLHAEPVDSLEIGGNTVSRDFANDGARNGAPGPGLNGYARGAFEEAIARPVDVEFPSTFDFVAMMATPGRANVPPMMPNDNTPPQLDSSLSGSNVPVTGPFWARFSETIYGPSAFQAGAINFVVNGAPVALRADFSIALSSDDPQRPDHELHIYPVGRLPFDATVEIHFAGGANGITDLAGMPLDAEAIVSFTTESAPSHPAQIVINEICVTPVRDWSNDEGGDETPFSPVPGDGPVDTEDEWLELLNTSDSEANLEDHQLVIYNGPTAFGAARVSSLIRSSASVALSSGVLTAVPAGARITLGNPIGTFNTHTFVSLRSGSGQLIDFVEIGGNSTSTDRGGDGVDNGAPSPGASGAVDFETIQFDDGGVAHYLDEVVARKPDGADTNDDIGDWVHQEATLGASND